MKEGYYKWCRRSGEKILEHNYAIYKVSDNKIRLYHQFGVLTVGYNWTEGCNVDDLDYADGTLYKALTYITEEELFLELI